MQVDKLLSFVKKFLLFHITINPGKGKALKMYTGLLNAKEFATARAGLFSNPSSETLEAVVGSLLLGVVVVVVVVSCGGGLVPNGG